jgi:TrmH family RNA methyltransferase
MNLKLDKTQLFKNEKYKFSKNISIILVAPEHPNNIGSVARAMNNMGFNDLRLVKPCDYLSSGKEGARTLAMHSQNILIDAQVFTNLNEAIIDKQIVIATTTRIRGQHKYLELSWNLPSLFSQLSHNSQIAFVFGREGSGLTNAEIDLCSHCISIPTFGENSSLNLAQAVMVILYEVSKILHLDEIPQKENPNLATSHHIESLKQNLFTVLTKIDYIKSGNESKRWSVFSKIIADKSFTEKEVNIFQGVLNKIKETIG